MMKKQLSEISRNPKQKSNDWENIANQSLKEKKPLITLKKILMEI